ncbi:YceD family protein [Rothia sp. LK2588]
METLDEVVPAPKDFGNALIGAEEGSDIDLNLRLESVVDGILITGTATVEVHGECSLCLDPVAETVSADIQELFVFEKAPAGGAEDEEDEQYAVEDDAVDLEPALRDAVILKLPFQPLCKDSCQGLCSECGIRLEEDPGHHHEVLDPRWSALAGMFNEDK